ncbi:integrase, catalytic region, zinc finger, CCHC-type containing protein [Tanacetum coccineum]|uniref:Integrase, catalytic region, zinc finger, CCHC-type containing protein n=1 Tax=Tanacetum coccineum TaxID=301880 RepID=A0ABQ5CKW8_9ASTR
MEQAAILRKIVEQATSLNPLDRASYTACKYVKLIQELLAYVRDTCPDIHKPSEKLAVVTPRNKSKKVRLQPIGNKRNDRISQASSSNIKNKVEAQPRKVNKKNHVVKPVYNVNVKQTMLNANSQLICVTCKQCMFDANHDVCFLNVVNEMNMRAKSKSKSKKKRQLDNIWKPTSKIFTEVGLKWKPTGRTFTLVIDTPKPKLQVYSRRPKQVKGIGSSKKAKIVKSKTANNSEPSHSWGSNATDVPSSFSLVNDRPIRVASVNGKKYILLIVEDYSRFIWVKFLASKDEAPDFIIKFLKMIQVRLNATVRNICTDNGTEFVNQTLIILNGNKVLKRTVGEVEKEYEPTSAEKKQDMRNDMKASGTLRGMEETRNPRKFRELSSSNNMRTLQDQVQKQWIKLLIGSINTSQNSQNVAFVSSNSTNSNNNSSINEAYNTNSGVVLALYTQSNPTSGDNLSDAVICAFLASQPNSPQLAREDLEQIDPDDLEEMDLQWEMAMLTIGDLGDSSRGQCRKLDVNVK